MIITIVTEFPQQNFQWALAWNQVNQRFNNCLIRSVEMSYEAFSNYGSDSPHWDNIRKADVVFVYCTRWNINAEKQNGWIWWNLPFYVKHLMRSDAKMILQFDDEFLALFHKGGMWWDDNPYGVLTPKEFFDVSAILKVADMYWTVLENPEWKPYCNKPVVFMPLPHLTRHATDIMKADKAHEAGFPNRQKIISMMLHSSVNASVEQTTDNLGKYFQMPIQCFTCPSSKPKRVHIPNQFKYLPNLNKENYMATLLNSWAAIDDNEGYLGWSRFVMECVINYVPCIGSTYAVKMFFPDLYTAPKDYNTQSKLVNRLSENKEFYNKVIDKAHENLKYIGTATLCESMAKTARYIYGGEGTKINITYEHFIDLLQTMLPSYVPPLKPSVGSTIYDSYFNKTLTPETWENIYGQYAQYMTSDHELRKHVTEALERNTRKLQ